MQRWAWLLLLILVGGAQLLLAAEPVAKPSAGQAAAASFRLATFSAEVTVPAGHGMMGGAWLSKGVADPLEAHGLVLLGSDLPIVYVAVDWCEIRNDAFARWQTVLAAAAGTQPQRVMVSTIHQHDAPVADLTAERLLKASKSPGTICDVAFHEVAVQRVAKALRESLAKTKPVTHVGRGQAKVERIASNRRYATPQGEVRFDRTSSTKHPVAIAAAEGLVDPWLKTLSFWNGDVPLAAVSCYAVHPMSYYGSGEVSADFPGIARRQRQRELPGVAQIYCTGCAGNITAGKYNDGARENRAALAERLRRAMADAWEKTVRTPLTSVAYRVVPVTLAPRDELGFTVPDLERKLRTEPKPFAQCLAALGLSWRERSAAGKPIDIPCLDFGAAQWLVLPGEAYVEFQLAAQQMRPESFVLVAGYGDGATGYIPTQQHYTERDSNLGDWCWVAPGAEDRLLAAMRQAITPPDVATRLPRVPPVDPQDALKTFDVQPGDRLDLVAAEPLVADPVACDFDAAARMYVVEMRDYSEQAKEKLGRVRRLEDTDGDGRFDKSTIFAEGLSWPTAIVCYGDGVFVGAAPDIFYLRDPDGDGVANSRDLVFTGLSRGNVQGMVNSFRWGLDQRIHVATSSGGGDVRVVAPAELLPGGKRPQVESLVLRGRDFSFDPRTFALRAESGAAQHGMSFDDWGRKFVCSNSNHIQLVMFEDRYAARNPLVPSPPPLLSIAADGPAADVFRRSPVEPWRVVRTELRVAGKVPGPIEGGGRPAGYFTSATGVTIVRGSAWPANERGRAVIGDVGSNLVHRKSLRPRGVELVAERIDVASEWVASRDLWFRPVQFANAPDGSLYLLDMYREVIEHPDSLPPIIKQHLDLTSGRDRGRIYRLAPATFRHVPPPRLDRADTTTLVATLAHDNAWHRETAARLLYERRDTAAVTPLARLAAESRSPLGRLHALYVLAGQDALTAAILQRALRDEHPGVRAHAVRLAETLAVTQDELRRELLARIDDPDPLVRYQLAFSLGASPQPEVAAALAELLRHDGHDPWIRYAVVNSCHQRAGVVLQQLTWAKWLHEPQRTAAAVEPLLRLAVRQGVLADEMLTRLQDCRVVQPAAADALLRTLLAEISAQRGRAALAAVSESAPAKRLLDQAERAITDESQPAADRAAAIRLVADIRGQPVAAAILQVLAVNQPAEVQIAALQSLVDLQPPETYVEELVTRWTSFAPLVRRAAIEAIFSRPSIAASALAAWEAGRLPLSDLDPGRLKSFAMSRNNDLHERATRLLAKLALGPRADVVRDYRDVLTLPGDAPRGRAIFQKTCAACHRLDDAGHTVGPDLATMRNRGAEAILLAILDPNREVNPQYVNYVARTTDGRQMTGILAAESSASLTLRRADNASDTLLRRDLEALQSTNLSLMPEGLEKQHTRQELADVIAYLLLERPSGAKR